MKKLIIVSIMALGIGTMLPGTANAQEVRYRPVPPAEGYYARPACPSNEHFWVDAHWRWAPRQGRYVWVRGHWQHRREGFVWAPGSWGRGRYGGEVWIPGHWVRG